MEDYPFVPAVYGPHDAVWLELDALALRQATTAPGSPEWAVLEAQMAAIEGRISAYENADRQLTLHPAFVQGAARAA